MLQSLLKLTLQQVWLQSSLELQGVMGKEYALLDGESEVAEAIFEQYLPRFAGDVLPSNRSR